ncbi:DUF2690 domain-containing protein [Streptomyces sp. NBC_01477]|uniref:DUF2690 domain-containing protein n=1 Tax=Streptomyces sp. NBC_01477 TaxID=2976015 RepID=UPI002E3598FE|nr:DUF2690 domain-containing protein [Streptomyces sp. NBC_01477]
MRIRNKIAAFAAGAVLTGGTILAGASTASAEDQGGNGNPYYDCANGYTVQSATIYNSYGTAVGTVELRWSWTCGGNWARVTVANGSSQNLTAVISPLPSNPNYAQWHASAYDTANQNWSPYVQVPSATIMCAYGAIGSYHAQTCSN